MAIAHPDGDHITPPAVIADWMERAGGGELLVLRDADHFLRDRAGEVTDFLGDFLAGALATG